MRDIQFILVCLGLAACSTNKKTDADFVASLLYLTTRTTSKEYSPVEYVQFTQLYDSLAHSLPDDKDEKLILVERLKKMGFEVTDWGRGNFPPLGPRIVIVELTKGSCICEVSKIYYATVQEGAYQMAEGINCKQVDHGGH